ncbi:MAG TPA: glutamine--fructose-6-phosphate transaminase (isomerizing) [Candidatus Angelobacter sp.]|nr:glutamine--fructose-6-phosphate transaminase (isomerizing) [Candidatus Angelobacter sp.]
MCGIVGYVGKKEVVPVILDGLRRMEYRGYDSAGIAVAGNGDGLQIRRAEGKLRNLENTVRQSPLDGTYGIGHTRWATHGRPTERNAHPHRDCTGKIVVVHNGIIENYLPLKKSLLASGHTFSTETDTEVIAHLVEKYKAQSATLEEAVRSSLKELRGVFALAVISADDPDKIVAVRNGPPAVIGLGNHEHFIASDLVAILNHTRDLFFLQDGDMAVIRRESVEITDFDGAPIARKVQHVTWDPGMAEKGGFRHFMLKEIYEQPRAVRDTCVGRISLEDGKITLEGLGISEDELRRVRKINIAACGTSWHAGLAAKFMIERLARVPVEVDYASEFRYRNPIVGPDEVTLLITQSGETADTVAAQREAKTKGSKTIAICNVVGAMVAREAEGTIYTHAGPEIGVASTKAFTAQLTALALFSLYLAQIREQLSASELSKYVAELSALPAQLELLLTRDQECANLAIQYSQAKDFLFLGRGVHYPIALEGALKLKEISYIHAEGYPAGEMKHGPNALIDKDLPVVVVATKDPNDPASVIRYEKTISNIKEAKARDGQIIALATDGDDEITEAADHVLYIPRVSELLLPILEVVPLQLLAYHIAVLRGCDVDQPRNLAKSVTVE